MFGFTGLSFKQFFTGKNISQFGTFAFDYANIKGAPNGVVSADSLTFVLTASGLSASQFTGVAVHFCTASGAGCGPNTGFASSTPITAVPEPGTLSLIGTGLIGLAALGGAVPTTAVIDSLEMISGGRREGHEQNQR